VTFGTAAEHDGMDFRRGKKGAGGTVRRVTFHTVQFFHRSAEVGVAEIVVRGVTVEAEPGHFLFQQVGKAGKVSRVTGEAVACGGLMTECRSCIPENPGMTGAAEFRNGSAQQPGIFPQMGIVAGETAPAVPRRVESRMAVFTFCRTYFRMTGKTELFPAAAQPDMPLERLPVTGCTVAREKWCVFDASAKHVFEGRSMRIVADDAGRSLADLIPVDSLEFRDLVTARTGLCSVEEGRADGMVQTVTEQAGAGSRCVEPVTFLQDPGMTVQTDDPSGNPGCRWIPALAPAGRVTGDTALRPRMVVSTFFRLHLRMTRYTA